MSQEGGGAYENFKTAHSDCKETRVPAWEQYNHHYGNSISGTGVKCAAPPPSRHARRPPPPVARRAAFRRLPSAPHATAAFGNTGNRRHDAESSAKVVGRAVLIYERLSRHVAG